VVSEQFGGRGGLLMGAVSCVLAGLLGTIALRRNVSETQPVA
jgi:hypothetical protein